MTNLHALVAKVTNPPGPNPPRRSGLGGALDALADRTRARGEAFADAMREGYAREHGDPPNPEETP